MKLSALHRFIIRNSDLFHVSELARFLGVTESQVRSWQKALGLPEVETIDRERAFPIVLRRNHDLLSESEIARLLGMSPDSCRKLALEMDFLDIKLGPKPEKLPVMDVEEADFDESARDFVSCCGAYLRDYDNWDRPFSFLQEFRKPEPAWDSAESGQARSDLAIRMMYS